MNTYINVDAIQDGSIPVEKIKNLDIGTVVDDKIAALVDSAPATLNTLNELAAALGDDPNFATTVATNIGKIDAKFADYLSLSGGTISGGSGALEIKRNGPYLSNIKFSNTDGKLGELGFVWANNPAFFHTDGNYYTLYHAGNFNPADYLPLSGGTINGSLILNSPNSDYALHFQTGVGAGWIGFQANTERWFVTNRNWSADYTIIHSGNVGDYALKKVANVTSLNTNAGEFFYSGFRPEHIPYGNYVGGITLQTFRDAENDYRTQLAFSTDAKGFVRSYINGAWYDWKTIAFTDSNVASATKLATARTIWGQSFDGTRNITGNLTLGNRVSLCVTDNSGTAIDAMYITAANHLVFGSGAHSIGGYTFIGGDNLFLRYGSPSPTIGVVLNQHGNVTIGGSDLAGTSAKLYVDGDAYISTRLAVGNSSTLSPNYTLYVGGNGKIKASTKSGIDTTTIKNSAILELSGSKEDALFIGQQSNSDMWMQAAYQGTTAYPSQNHTYNLLLQPLGGNVLIGTTENNGGKLQVAGSALFNRYNATGNSAGCAIVINKSSNFFGIGASSSDVSRISFGTALNTAGDWKSEFMTITDGGNVGIGTTNPTYRLDVAGSIRTTSSLTIGTIVLTDENGTLKIAGNAYTTGQLGAGEAGQPTSGGGSVVLDYDSIVDALGFAPAKQTDLTSLINRVSSIENTTYSSLHGDDITIDAVMYGIAMTAEGDIHITSVMGGVLVNDSEVLTKANTSFTRSYTSGTKIGTIKIGGVSTDIYVPTSGSSSLWSTEYDMTVGTEVLFGSKEYIGTNTIVGWDSAGLCVNDLYIGYDGYTIWMQGSVDEASDMRLKTVIDAVNLDIRDIAFAPIFNYVFKSRPQGRQMLGSSAQYWQAIAPKAVSENDKGNLAMNYGAIALASVVAVAKKTLTHEEEIAELKLKVQSLENRLARYELN